MKELEREILIIGAGPAGISAAIEAAKAGAKVTVADEHDTIVVVRRRPVIYGVSHVHIVDRERYETPARGEGHIVANLILQCRVACLESVAADILHLAAEVVV